MGQPNQDQDLYVANKWQYKKRDYIEEAVTSDTAVRRRRFDL